MDSFVSLYLAQAAFRSREAQANDSLIAMAAVGAGECIPVSTLLDLQPCRCDAQRNRVGGYSKEYMSFDKGYLFGLAGNARHVADARDRPPSAVSYLDSSALFFWCGAD